MSLECYYFITHVRYLRNGCYVNALCVDFSQHNSLDTMWSSLVPTKIYRCDKLCSISLVSGEDTAVLWKHSLTSAEAERQVKKMIYSNAKLFTKFQLLLIKFAMQGKMLQGLNVHIVCHYTSSGDCGPVLTKICRSDG